MSKRILGVSLRLTSAAFLLLPMQSGLIRAQTTPAAMAGAHGPSRPSQTLRVATPGGEVSFSPEELRGLPQAAVTVHNAHSNAEEQYTGVKLTDLLAKAGLKQGKGTLHSYVVAAGTDGYWVLFSGEEVSDVVHAGTVLVAISQDGHALGKDGLFKLISTEDRKPERWVRNLESIRWMEAAQ